jgi:hypothetical protein
LFNFGVNAVGKLIIDIGGGSKLLEHKEHMTKNTWGS